MKRHSQKIFKIYVFYEYLLKPYIFFSCFLHFYIMCFETNNNKTQCHLKQETSNRKGNGKNRYELLTEANNF